MISALNAMKFSRISQWRRSFFQIAAITECCSGGSLSDAQRAFGLLAGRVGADRRTVEDHTRVYLELAAVDREVEAVEPARRGAGFLFADAVVLRTVARAF